MESVSFKHEPLPAGDFIRILHVESSDNNGESKCTFETIPLGSKSHQYTAISYTWGDTTVVRQVPCSDGQLISLSRTLSDLFDALSRKHDVFSIYVDALCINQTNPTEKAHQVRLIGGVYLRAHTVMVWLGDSDEQSRNAFHYMEKGILQDRLSNEGRSSLITPTSAVHKSLTNVREPAPSTQQVVDAFMTLLKRQWFQRVWVIQEAILGATVSLTCGDDTVDFQTFESSILSLWKCPEIVDYLDMRHPSYLGFRCATHIFAIQEEFDRCGRVSLGPLLEALFYYSATDSRDFIFAIQGIARSVHLLPSPDYTASIETIFSTTAENILCKASLDLFSVCGLGPREQALEFLRYRGLPANAASETLPSWVPDFRQTAYHEPILLANRGGWCAGGSLGRRPSRSHEGIEVDTIILDGIVNISDEIDTMSFDELKSSITSIFHIAGEGGAQLSHQSFNAIWRTLVLDLDEDTDPATPELGQQLLDLLKSFEDGRTWEDVKKIDFYRLIRIRSDSWRIFVSSNGYLGITWPLVEEGDCICLLPGCRFPLIIRPVDGDSRCKVGWSQGVLIGWCYVHGIMHGEAIARSLEAKRITLV